MNKIVMLDINFDYGNEIQTINPVLLISKDFSNILNRILKININIKLLYGIRIVVLDYLFLNIK